MIRKFIWFFRHKYNEFRINRILRTFGLPKVQHVVPRHNISSELILVQPMEKPTSTIFYLDFIYGGQQLKLQFPPEPKKPKWEQLQIPFPEYTPWDYYL